jgi:metal-responsive CopG/Arc/MetJ family transcriptional regulator
MTEELKKIFVRLPVSLVDEIDHQVGPRKRSPFLAEAAERELKRRNLAAQKSEQIQEREAADGRSVN